MGRIIKRTYKYIIPTPEELFERFKIELTKRSQFLPESWTASKPWTSLILDIFDKIGRYFGFTPRTEYLRLDQTWEIRFSDLSEIVLALEHENTYRVDDILNDELQKLLDIKAYLKVLVFYPEIPVHMQGNYFIYPEIQEKIRSCKIKIDDEIYIIISLVNVRNEGLLEVSACSFDAEGNGKDLGAFQVKYTSID